MSGTDQTPAPPDGDDTATAAEYALGLLPADEAEAFEARLASEPALRALLAVWQTEFAALAQDVPAVTPSPALRGRIQAAAFGAPEARVWWQSLWPYAGGAVAAALIAWVVAVSGLLSPAPQILRSQLAPAEGAQLAMLVTLEPATHTLTLTPVPGTAAVAQGRALELWVIAEGQAPVSLGLLSPEGATAIVVPDAVAPLVRAGVLAVSDEPEGGSPTGAPTGAVLATGRITPT